ncbi:aminotransferase class V-fold PLP-dependent enzyme [Pseudomonas quasicaspiana]|uniref:aminotransferase class V-fold PLP-dependent enzyme n=1 Tax=Pseudomonas quasicaspiana TaxID=2829821 RepID=UPI001E63F665|nr:aminotransferase class V-fold PLP-dependent enzyme [Pseudomonas quasicaspiana]MCD5976992.1 aminotransferase class V-fold PLP-dependent enzyme [Pseudomonas quasicaspiana]
MLEQQARDEQFWQDIAGRYDVEPGPINLENGYFGRMTREVMEDYRRNIDYVNRSNSVYVRRQFDTHESGMIHAELAQLLQVSAEEIAITRCASESLQSLIRNYNQLQPGDQVLICDLDYISVQSAMRWLAKSRGVEVIEISHVHPATYESLLNSYQQAFEQYPRLKLMALTHVTHRTGLVMPVQAIAGLAKEHGVDIILDGAHALGQLDFKLDELGVAFAGYNLQKWIGAPLSLGFIYVARERISAIDPDMGDTRYSPDNILSLVPYGTPNIPAWMTLPKVFEEHAAMGGSASKGARLNYLRDLWVKPSRGLDHIEILTPDDPRLYCGITALRFTRQADQQKMVKRLLEDYNLFTVAREGAACGPCIRITPGFSTSAADMGLLVEALQKLDQ